VVTTDVLIIGAGAAGLAAAHDLTNAGLRVVVVEARDRIGGRICTHFDSVESFPVELGAEFLHGKSPELLSLLREAHLSFEQVSGNYWYLRRGQFVDSSGFWKAVSGLMSKMKDRINDESFKDYLNSIPDEAQAKKMAEGYVEGFHAARSERIGIHGLVAIDEASKQIDGDHAFRLLEGYSSLTTWLFDQSRYRGARFFLNTLVNELSWEEDRVTAKCVSENFNDIIAHKILITVPLSILKLPDGHPNAVRFVPALPDAKLNAINAIEVGPAIRVVLRFSEPFWEKLELTDAHKDLKDLGFINSDDVSLPTWWSTLPQHHAILVGWAGGRQAEKLGGLSDEEISNQAVESLASIFNIAGSEVRSYISQVYFHNWQEDSLSRGAYAYLPVNGLDHQLNLARPVANTLFFAGEATSVGHIGTVHGAIQTGKRAAREILSATNR